MLDLSRENVLTYMLLGLEGQNEGPSRQIPPTGWQELDGNLTIGNVSGTYGFASAPSGFSATTYINESEGRIIISYNPTQDGADALTDANLLIGKLDQQIKDAALHYQAIKEQYPGMDISFGGYSLGGGIASLMGVFFNKPAISHDEAPFRLAATEKNANILDNYLQSMGFASDPDLTSYYANQSLIPLSDNVLADLAVRFIAAVGGTLSTAGDNLSPMIELAKKTDPTGLLTKLLNDPIGFVKNIDPTGLTRADFFGIANDAVSAVTHPVETVSQTVTSVWSFISNPFGSFVNTVNTVVSTVNNAVSPAVNLVGDTFYNLYNNLIGQPSTYQNGIEQALKGVVGPETLLGVVLNIFQDPVKGMDQLKDYIVDSTLGLLLYPTSMRGEENIKSYAFRDSWVDEGITLFPGVASSLKIGSVEYLAIDGGQSILSAMNLHDSELIMMAYQEARFSQLTTYIPKLFEHFEYAGLQEGKSYDTTPFLNGLPSYLQGIVKTVAPLIAYFPDTDLAFPPRELAHRLLELDYSQEYGLDTGVAGRNVAKSLADDLWLLTHGDVNNMVKDIINNKPLTDGLAMLALSYYYHIKDPNSFEYYFNLAHGAIDFSTAIETRGDVIQGFIDATGDYLASDERALLTVLATGDADLEWHFQYDKTQAMNQTYTDTANQVVIASVLSDNLSMGDGNDIVFTGTGDDTVQAANGNNMLHVGSGNDLVVAGSGNDGIYLGDGNDTVNAGDGNNVVYGGTGKDLINTGSGNDSIDAGAGADMVHAGAGNDTLISGSRDVLGAQGDVLDGGDGSDWVDYSQANQYATVDLVQGFVKLDEQWQATNANTGGAVVDTLVSIENARGGSRADYIIGSAADNVLDAGAGNNTIVGNGGNDTVISGSGHDTITTGSDNDWISAGTGNNLINTGAGVDTVDYAGITGNLNIGTHGAGFRMTVAGGQVNDTLTMDGVNNVEVYVLGSGNDTFNGSVYGETVYAGAGNDVFKGTRGVAADSNYFDGGSGVDMVSYAHVTQAISINLNDTQSTIAIGMGIDTLVSVEGMIATQGNDTLVGNSDTNLLDGQNGSDILIGQAGNDTLRGGSGKDYYRAGSGDDLIDEQLGNGIDTVDYSDVTGGVTVAAYGGYGSDDGAFTVTGVSGTDSIDNVGANSEWGQLVEVFTLSDGNDRFIGTRFAETVLAGAGDDTLTSGSRDVYGMRGSDVLNGGAGSDWVDYSQADQYTTVNLVQGIAKLDEQWQAGDANYAGAQQIDTLISIENVRGSNRADYIMGTIGDNILDGAAGNNTIVGNGGNDTLLVGIGLDKVYAGSGNDYIDLDTSGRESWVGRYGEIRNSADAGAGNNTVLGSGDNDSITAGSGNDLIQLYSGNDSVSAGDGNNTIISSDGVEDRVTTGTGDDYIRLGNADRNGVDNVISAGDGHNTVISGNGHDIITTGSGNDWVNAGTGADKVSLGAGNDLFVIDKAYVSDGLADVVNGEQGYDAIVFDGAGISLDLSQGRFGNTAFGSFERIDITGSGDNTLMLNVNDVLQVTDQIMTQAMMFIVDGNAGDTFKRIGNYFGTPDDAAGTSIWVDLNADGVNNSGDFSGVADMNGQVTFNGAAGTQTYSVYQNNTYYGTMLIDANILVV